MGCCRVAARAMLLSYAILYGWTASQSAFVDRRLGEHRQHPALVHHLGGSATGVAQCLHDCRSPVPAVDHTCKAQSSRVDLSDTVIDRGTARTTTLAHRAANSALVVFIADSQPPCVGLRKFLEFVVV
jgi:hypothetical protein